MNIRILIISSLFAFSAITTQLFAQLTIEDCYQLARDNYPLVSKYELIEKSANYTISNAKRSWLPQLSISGQATYQSETIAFPEAFGELLQLAAAIPGMSIDPDDLNLKPLNKDQYKIAVQLEQTIWDGGYTKSKVDEAKANRDVERESVEVEMFKVRDRINQLFFGTLLLNERMKELNIMEKELQRNYDMIQSYVNNGVATRGDLDQIKLEQLKLNQSKEELNSNIQAFTLMLGVMIGRDIADDIELIRPVLEEVVDVESNRPELRLLDAQYRVLDARRSAVNASVMPHFGAFIQGAYGYPGLNMFNSMINSSWSPYFVAGIKFQWNIGGFYTKGNNLSTINTNQTIVENQRDLFLYNMNLSVIRQQTEITKMKNILSQDDEIIALSKSIKERAENELKNGTITVRDFLKEVNAESRARQTKITHEIELLSNIYDLKNTVNN